MFSIRELPIMSKAQVGKYNIGAEIGSGGFATVYLGQHIRTGEKVAIKVIERSTAKDFGLLPYIETELRLVSMLNHPNIARVYDIIYTDEFIYIIMEYFENGSLQNFIDCHCRFPQADQIRVATEILEGLNYLHSRGISHRDIKPANIMFDKEMHAKIIDFGFSREFNCGKLSTVCGTQEMMAPELMCGKVYDGMMVDIWAFGITLHLMCELVFPFEYTSDSQLIYCAKTNTFNFQIKAQGIIGWLIHNCLKYDPKERMTVKQMLDHLKKTARFAAPNSLGRIEMVKRTHTLPHVPHIKVHPNTPVVFKARHALENNLLRQKMDLRKKIRSLEHI